MRKEGATVGRKPVNLHLAGRAVRFLHGRELRRSSRLHCLAATRLQSAAALRGGSRAGCL